MYSQDSYSIHDYGFMIKDELRTSPFVDALRAAIRPGSVVLDIGTGTGYFSFVAVQAGAARVYAIEPDRAIEVAKLCAKDVPDSDRITWIQGLSTDLELPEKVDIVIGDLHGVLPFHNHNIGSMIDARTRHLKPGGVIIPGRDLLRIVPAHAPREYDSVETPWQRNTCGLDLSAGRPFVTNQWWRALMSKVAGEDLLGAPATWGVVDYMTVESANMEADVSWMIERDATMHGYYVWFDGEIAKGLGYSNAPDLEGLVYGRAFFPLHEAVDVVVGDRVETRMGTHLVKGEHIYRWDTRISDANGNTKASFKQSTLRSHPLNRKELERTTIGHVPVLNQDGQIALAVIQAMQRSRTLGDIAQSLSDLFPSRFKDHQEALSHATKLTLKFSESA